MKKIILIASLIFSTSAFADLNVRVICGMGSSASHSVALRNANDQLNRKLKIGIINLSSVSDPKINDNHEKSLSINICVTVVAENFSDLAL